MSDSRLFQARVRWLSLGLTLVVVAATGLGVLQYCWAEIEPPTSTERDVTRIVTQLMQSSHLSRHPLDDEISRRGFKLFIEGLDPMKCYFYQSDIDEFEKFEDKLDDMLQRYDTRFGHAVFKRFLERIDERVATVDDILKHDIDFTVDEEMVTDPDLLHYPKDEAEARKRWEQRIKYDLLLLKLGTSDDDNSEEAVDPAKADAEAREKLSKRYRNFKRRMGQFDNDELLETYLTAFTTAYDPHTTYMSPSAWENFRIDLRLNLDGIGARLQDDFGKTVVASVVPGGAADKHGKLKKDDVIVSVGQGEEGEMEDIVGQKLNDVVSKIRGPAGTTVRLGVIPAGKKDTIIYKITRAKIQLEDSAAHGEVLEVGSKPNGAPMKVGVIDLPSFYQDMEGKRRRIPNFRSATRDVRKILAGFKEQGVDAVVLDLRRNGGGSLDEAVDLTGLFIDKGTVVQVMDYDKYVRRHDDEDAGMAWDGPLVVVTSKLSASASEILAGAIQDYRRGLVVGDTSTHGKGTVQTPQPLGEVYGIPFPPNLGVLKITIQQFFRPNGDSTQKRGVLADIVLPSITNHMDVGESDLDYAIDFKRIERSSFSPLNLVTGQLIAKLRAKSNDRVGKSEDFAKLLKRIEAYEGRKARKSVTLNEKKFMEEANEVNVESEEEERLAEELTNSKIKRDYYLDEVLMITRDYVNELQQNKFAHVN